MNEGWGKGKSNGKVVTYLAYIRLLYVSDFVNSWIIYALFMKFVIRDKLL